MKNMCGAVVYTIHVFLYCGLVCSVLCAVRYCVCWSRVLIYVSLSFLILLVSLPRYHEYVGSSSGHIRSMIQGVFTVPMLLAEKAVELIVSHFSEGDDERIVVPTAECNSDDWDIFDES